MMKIPKLTRDSFYSLLPCRSWIDVAFQIVTERPMRVYMVTPIETRL